ncbi:hypothetical protein [Mucilaginibacter psychrotolerans]|uniref:hypothetical protein n=1 Tax=Mucilaginibacter psychrotolerans TaxID=1524096 RepID=UPI00130522C6|nr:hypothetical protein [Mucilaginibacter psychrotolerans]
MMKEIIVGCLVLCAIIVLASCGKYNSSNDAVSTSGSVPQSLTISVDKTALPPTA